MEEDDLPNFGNAFPSSAAASSASAAQPSWNPALRPDSEHRQSAASRHRRAPSEDDFFDRYPGATPEKNRLQRVQEQVRETEEDGDNAKDEESRRQSISVEHSIEVSHHPAPMDEEERRPSSFAKVEAPLSQHSPADGDKEAGDEEAREEETADEESGDEKAADEEAGADPETAIFEQSGSVVYNTDLNGTDQIDHAAAAAAAAAPAMPTDVSRPEANYEHQSGVPEMEKAIDESADAPLMEDEEPAPTTGIVSRKETLNSVIEAEADFDKDGGRPHRDLGRSFTTNFTEPPVVEEQSLDVGQSSNDWPPVGDDKTFGELLDNEQRPDSHQQRESVPAQDAAGPSQQDPSTQDLSAAWAAALDDDDILDDVNELDPSAYFGNEDEDGFLEDEEPFPPPQTAPQPARPTQQQRSVSAYTPAAAQNAAQPSPYTAPTSPFIDQAHGRSAGTPSTGLYDLHSQPQPPQQKPTRPPAVTAQSFVDKPKSGYQSPYDLPMDVAKPRRRPQPTPRPTNTAPTPPMRSSSFGATALNAPPKAPSVASLSPPNSSHGSAIGAAPSAAHAPGTTSTAKSTPKSDSGFFADLPATAKARPRPTRAYTPSVMPTTALAPQQPPPSRGGPPGHLAPVRTPQPPMGPPTPAQQPPTIGGLRQPERAPLFPEQPSPAPTAPQQTVPSAQTMAAPPQTQGRYSPAPVPAHAPAAAASRYSPAPAGQPSKPNQRFNSAPTSTPSQPPPPRPVQAYAPRTSSPLAIHGKPQSQTELPAELTRTVSSYAPGPPGQANGVLTSASISPVRRDSSGSRYTPPSSSASVQESNSGAGTSQIPLQRARTQSPVEARRPQTLSYMSEQSATASQAASFPAFGSAIAQSHPHQNVRLTHRRKFSRDLPFAAPQDERVHDPLERWKGHPIFHWGNGGAVVSCFPRQTPFYAAGIATPSIKCTPGEIRVTDASAVMPMTERDAKFPGPLPARSKGKKKDVMAWLIGKTEDLGREVETAQLNFDLPAEERKRIEEKLLLWKIMRIFVEHDGTLEGSPKIEEEVRQVLMPDLAQASQAMDFQSPASASLTGDPVDTTVVFQIRQALFEGQRERAVWLAEEKRLWGHAMLIASTIGPDTFRQIVASFVRGQVKSSGASEARSLAALYQVFAGNPEECVDELVPPSARAGFQMVSKTDGKGSGNPLEGLDQWRETLSLVHSNPTPGNGASLLALGKLLAGYGRMEAAHTCFLFARSVVKHSGADDTEANFVLLGANHAAGDANLDSIMLTEVFEYASSLSAPATAAHYVPHLQAYKFIHAQDLAAAGMRAKAQSYCEHIDAAIRSTTRPSGYYHPAFAQELMTFNAFLSQNPQTGTGAGGKFFSRPAMDKMSSGVGSWFTKFVAGEEGETDSNASGQGASDGEMYGPFGGVPSGSVPLSRSASGIDLHHSSAAAAPPWQSAAAPNRFAPPGGLSANRYAPAGTPQPAGSRSSFDSDRSLDPHMPSSMPSAEPIRPAGSRYAPVQTTHSPSMLDVPIGAGQRQNSAPSIASSGSYEPKPMFAEQDGFGYLPHAPGDDGRDEEGGHAPPHTVGLEDAEPSFDPETGGGYEPTGASYEPPSYQPYQPEPAQDAEEEEEAARPKSKKKSFMDDDDDADIASRAAALKRPQADREPDPAIVAAAQADAARNAKGQDKKGNGPGWFGGWFGKKEAEAGPGPIRAKLGEESSFYFDKDLNKWVNKKAGAESASPAAPTPPPPRGPPSSTNLPAVAMSAGPLGGAPGIGAGGPPLSGPPSRAGTPASNAGSAGPLQRPFPAAGMNGDRPSMVPPPRPSSTMSTASSLDELLGGPPGPGKKGGTVKGKKKGGRYVDVMANAK